MNELKLHAKRETKNNDLKLELVTFEQRILSDNLTKELKEEDSQTRDSRYALCILKLKYTELRDYT